MGHYTTKAQQNQQELDAFVKLLKNEKIASFLEIGSKFGGVIWAVAKIMPPASKIVSVDWANQPWGRSDSVQSLKACFQELKAVGHDAHLLDGDSTAPEIVEKVYALGPFDACFIDANHTLPYVTKDWNNYSKICKLVAFHDISAWRPNNDWRGRIPIEVPMLWNEIKKDHRHVEIKLDPRDNGIGVLWL
jgi:cephalosporin hydroxylase